MSTENLQSFYRRFRDDEALAELQSLGDVDAYASAIVALGSENGFAFDAEEVKAALDDPQAFLGDALEGDELSDLELEYVSAGGGKKTAPR